MKDYYLELIQLVPDDPEKAYKQAQHAQDEISGEIKQLTQQLEHVENLMQYLLPQVSHVFTDQGGKPWIRVPPVDRSKYVQQAADALVKAGKTRITVQDVRNILDRSQTDLGVTQPNAVIGTVLAGSPDFQKVDVNVFDYVGDSIP